MKVGIGCRWCSLRRAGKNSGSSRRTSRSSPRRPSRAPGVGSPTPRCAVPAEELWKPGTRSASTPISMASAQSTASTARTRQDLLHRRPLVQDPGDLRSDFARSTRTDGWSAPSWSVAASPAGDPQRRQVDQAKEYTEDDQQRSGPRRLHVIARHALRITNSGVPDSAPWNTAHSAGATPATVAPG